MGEISSIPPSLRSRRRTRDIRRILVIQRCVFLVEGKEEKRRGRKRKMDVWNNVPWEVLKRENNH
jgi:hypothetical protein